MNLIIEIDTIKKCIDDLHGLAQWYDSYANVFLPSNFSVPSSSNLSSRLDAICKNYQGIKTNLESVALFLENYVNDLENIENRMGGLGSVKAFECMLECPSVSETSGLIEKPYAFSNIKIFDRMYNVTFNDHKYDEEGSFYSQQDLQKIASCEILIDNKDVQAMMHKYGISEKEALEALHKAAGNLHPGDKMADGKLFAYGMGVTEKDLALTVRQFNFIKAYNEYQKSYLLDVQYAAAEKSKVEASEVIEKLGPIEKKLIRYGYPSFGAYQREKNEAYGLALNEVKRNLDYYRKNSEGIALLGVSRSEVASLSDDELAALVLKKDKSVGVSYQRLLEIGNKVGYDETFENKLNNARLLQSQSILTINNINQQKLALPYETMRYSKKFNDFTYDIPEVTLKVETVDSGFSVWSDDKADAYTIFKNFKNKYNDSSEYHFFGVDNMEAMRDLESISKNYPELEKEYYYILKYQGNEEAKKYLKDMTGTFAQLAGELHAADRLKYLDSLPNGERRVEISNVVQTFGYGLGDGYIGWFENVAHINDGKNYNSASEWEKMYFLAAISPIESKKNGGYLVSVDGGVKSVSNVIDFNKDYGEYNDISYFVGQGVGNQIPAMTAGFVFSPLGAGASQFASLGHMGAGAYGNTYHQMKVQGYSEDQAREEALLTAGAEVVTERVYGGLPFTNSGPVYNFPTFGISMLKEGFQELLQDFNEPIIHAYVTGEIPNISDVNWSDFMHEKGQTFFVGALVSGFLNIPGALSNVSNIKVNQNNLNLIGSDLNIGKITETQASNAVNKVLNIGELSNSDVKSILKMDNEGISKLPSSKSGSVDPSVVTMLEKYSDLNKIKNYQQELIDNTPGLNDFLKGNKINKVEFPSQDVASAFIKYDALEKSVENINNFLEGRSVNSKSIISIFDGIQELLKNDELTNIIYKKQNGERIVVPSHIAKDFENYQLLLAQLKAYSSGTNSSANNNVALADKSIGSQKSFDFKTSILNVFNSELDKLCLENKELRGYLLNPTQINISNQLQKSIDKLNQLKKSFSESQRLVIDEYLSNQEDVSNLLAGRSVSELNNDEYNNYKKLIQKNNSILFQSSTVVEQLQFLNGLSRFATEEEIIKKYDNFDKAVQRVIVQRLLSEQSSILERGAIDYDTYQAKMFLSNHLEYISDISSQNLSFLFRTVSDKEAVLNEVLRRVEKKDLVFDSPFGFINKGPGLTINPSKDFWDYITTNRSDITNKVVDLYSSMKTPLYNDMFNKVGENLSDIQRLSLASLIYHNKITNNNVSAIIDSLQHFSQYKQDSNVNIGIYQDEIIHDLGMDFVNSIVRFPSLTFNILSLKEEANSAYKLFTEIVQDSARNSLYVQEELVMNALPYLIDHSSMNYSQVNVHDFEQFLLIASANSDLDLEYKNNFTDNFRQFYENQLEKSTSLEEGKNAYFMAKYSMSLKEVQTFLHTYGTNIDEISNEMNSSDYNLFNTLREEFSKSSLDEFKMMYSKSSNKTKIQILELGNSIKDIYIKKYVDAFKQTRELLNSSNSQIIDGVKVISVQEYFDLLLRSTNSGVSIDVMSKPDSWVNSYEKPLNSSAVGVSTCYVNQDNFGYMKTGNAGVLYGYVPTEASNILTMGTQDIDSQVTSYGARATSGSQYVLPNFMSEYNTRGYSEFAISFDNAKPDYVVLMSDASDQVRINTFEAAKEWGIPVLKFDVEKIFNQQVNSINNNIGKYISTKDCQYLLKAISLYESSANSFGFNAVGKNDLFFDDRSYLKGRFDAIPIHQLALEYAQSLVKSANYSDGVKFKNGLQNILDRYKNTNDNSNVVIGYNTKNLTGIESIIDELNKLSDSAVTFTYSNETNISSFVTPLDKIKSWINDYNKSHNLSFFEHLKVVNNRYNPTTVRELKQGILDSVPFGLSNLEKARFVYLALSQQLSFDENLNSNPTVDSYETTLEKYLNINDDTVLNKKTVCLSWARIYSDLLTSLGIDNRYQGYNERGHSWVEFDAGNGVFVRADATKGSIMDLTRAKLGRETLNFLPIDQYSKNPYNGEEAIPIFNLEFYNNLMRIDKNIEYINEEYNKSAKISIIDDVSTVLSEKIKLFSSRYLSGLDIVGAKDLLLEFVNGLKKSGYDISGTDMYKLKENGNVDIINISCILDENGQYRYFALHDGMGLTEISVRDLNVLKSTGYEFVNLSNLKGYHFNEAAGAVNSFMNGVISKAARLFHVDLIEDTKATNSMFESMIEKGLKRRNKYSGVEIEVSPLISGNTGKNIKLSSLLAYISDSNFEQIVKDKGVADIVDGYTIHEIVGGMKNLLEYATKNNWNDIGINQEMLARANRCVELESVKYARYKAILNTLINVGSSEGGKSSSMTVGTLLGFINDPSFEDTFQRKSIIDTIDGYTIHEIVGGMKELLDSAVKNNWNDLGLNQEILTKVNSFVELENEKIATYNSILNTKINLESLNGTVSNSSMSVGRLLNYIRYPYIENIIKTREVTFKIDNYSVHEIVSGMKNLLNESYNNKWPNFGLTTDLVNKINRCIELENKKYSQYNSILNHRISLAPLIADGSNSSITVKEILGFVNNPAFEAILINNGVDAKIDGYTVHEIVDGIKKFMNASMINKWPDLGISNNMVAKINSWISLEDQKYIKYLNFQHYKNVLVSTVSPLSNAAGSFVSVSELMERMSNPSFYSISDPNFKIGNYTVFELTTAMINMFNLSAKNKWSDFGLTIDMKKKVYNYYNFIKRANLEYTDTWNYNRIDKFSQIFIQAIKPIYKPVALQKIIDLITNNRWKYSKEDGNYSTLVRAWDIKQVLPTKAEVNNYWNSVFSNAEQVIIQNKEGEVSKSIEQLKYRIDRNSNNYFVHVRDGNVKTDCKLYLNITLRDAYRLLPQYIAECKKRGLNFYYKTTGYFDKVYTNNQFNRDEAVVFYINNSSFVEHYNIISQLLANNNMHVYNPPILSLWLANGLGYGNDINLNGKKLSYNESRANLIGDAYDEVLRLFGNANINSLKSKIAGLSSRYRISPNDFYISE